MVTNHNCCPCDARDVGYQAGDTIGQATNPATGRDWDQPNVLAVMVGLESGGYYCVDNNGDE
jgi:hypothetical protein